LDDGGLPRGDCERGLPRGDCERDFFGRPRGDCERPFFGMLALLEHGRSALVLGTSRLRSFGGRSTHRQRDRQG
jgi:hypothetical protein